MGLTHLVSDWLAAAACLSYCQPSKYYILSWPQTDPAVLHVNAHLAELPPSEEDSGLYLTLGTGRRWSSLVLDQRSCTFSCPAPTLSKLLS